MKGIISTILTFLRGLGGAGPVNQVVTEPHTHVSTAPLYMYSTDNQGDTPGCVICYTIKGMHHSLYTHHNILIYSKLGRGVPQCPDPQIGSVGLERVPLYLPANFYRTKIPVSIPRNFYAVEKHC